MKDERLPVDQLVSRFFVATFNDMEDAPVWAERYLSGGACWAANVSVDRRIVRWQAVMPETVTLRNYFDALFKATGMSKPIPSGIDFVLKDVNAETVREWLMFYAWMGTPEEQKANVDCIMAQRDVVSIVDGLTERYAGQAFDDTQAVAAQGHALSSLYECHSEPHIPTCPSLVGYAHHRKNKGSE